jgi:hypothetical protein
LRGLNSLLSSFGLAWNSSDSLPGEAVGKAVVLNNKLGSRVANLKPLGRPVDGQVLFNHKLDELFSLLDRAECTLLVMIVWLFLSSLSSLYYSSGSRRDILFY